MQGITITVEGGEAVIRVDLSSDLGLSKSGKSRLVASTSGNVTIPGTDVKLGLNAYRPAR